MKPLVLSPTQQAEAVGNLVAVRQVAVEMHTVFSKFGAKDAADARQGAERMITAINRVLELLDAPPELLDSQN